MSLKTLQTNRHSNRKLIMEKMSNTLLINILGGLLPACQIVIHFDVLLFYGLVMHCFGP